MPNVVNAIAPLPRKVTDCHNLSQSKVPIFTVNSDPDPGWIKWMPVIFPAIASIVTSLATSFPFQENWMAANRAVELLEAEQEKFILGVTPAYRFFDLPDDKKRKQKVQESVESFIAKVNQIHLKQFLQESTDAEVAQTKEAVASVVSAQLKSASAS